MPNAYILCKLDITLCQMLDFELLPPTPPKATTMATIQPMTQVLVTNWSCSTGSMSPSPFRMPTLSTPRVHMVRMATSPSRPPSQRGQPDATPPTIASPVLPLPICGENN